MDFLKKVLETAFKKVDDTSPAGKLNSTDLAKTLRTTGLVSVAAGLTYFLGNWDPTTIGNYALFLVPILTAALEVINKLIKDNK